jgi:hypothetical protein
MATAAETVAAYIAAWNEADVAKRKPLLETAWADDGAYIDPVSDVKGRDGLEATIAGFHAQQPGARIDLTSGIDQHHNQIRFRWDFVGPDGKIAISGIDVGEIAPDGRLARIVGFWAEPPAK